MRTRRERRSRQALALLGRARFLAFLRAVHQPGPCFAVTLFLNQVDAGDTVAAILFDGEQYGFSLEVEALPAGSFYIRFGCLPDPAFGDGGEWEVGFDADGAVVSVVPGIFWVS